MYNPRFQKQFRKDYRTCELRGYDMSLLIDVMTKLENGDPLDSQVNRPHPLIGTNPAITECHIKGDWLLEFRYDGNDLFFIRTGTHSDLFG